MIFKPFLRESFMPLPVAFISTVSRDGIRNIAPYSCIMPVLRPLDLICLASAWKRDTLNNIKETEQFVVNLAGESLADKVIPTARPEPPEVDEFESAGLNVKPSELIVPPGLAGAYAWMECRLHMTYEEDNYILVLGKVLRLEVADEFLTADEALDIAKAKPLIMTGSRKGMHFSTLADTGHYQPFGAMFSNGKDPLSEKYR
jgi:flavin reductase (DIM6/NTAB) family NADH-FMN oxidoreductase RutF